MSGRIPSEILVENLWCRWLRHLETGQPTPTVVLCRKKKRRSRLHRTICTREVRNYCASVTHIAVCEAQRERLRVEREKLKYDSVSARVCATVALPSLVSVTGQIGFQATGFLPPPMGEEKRKDPMDVISYPCTWSVWNWWRLARKVLFNRC